MDQKRDPTKRTVPGSRSLGHCEGMALRGYGWSHGRTRKKYFDWEKTTRYTQQTL